MLGLYRRLLGLLPPSFREEFGAEMCAVVAEDRAGGGGEGTVGAIGFWLRQFKAVIWLAVSLRAGRSTRHEEGRGGEMEGFETFFGQGFMQDIRHSVRSLLKRPGFTAVTALTLGLGVGATTVIFSAVNTVLIRDLPYPDSDRIVAIRHVDRETGELGEGMSAANALDISENAEFLQYVGVADPFSQDLQVDGRAESLQAWAVAEGFLEALGVQPIMGRSFAPEEYLPDSEAVVLLGHRSWRARFGGDPAIVGTTLSLDGADQTVIGVLPAWFKLPSEAELWLPRAPQSYDAPSRRADYMMGLAKLAPGSTLERAQAEVDRISGSLSESYPATNRGVGFQLTPLRDFILGDVGTALLVVMGAVGFVLLIACANVAGLMLARGAERQREYALRGALGAGSGRLMRLVVLESLAIAVLGSAFGILLTYTGIWAIRALGPDHLPRIEEIGVDGSVLAFALLAAGLSAFLAGLAPALRLSKPDLRETLGQGARGTTGSRSTFVLRNRLVVAQVAVAMVLLIGAGLLGRSFLVLMDQDLGFDPENRLAVQVFAYGYADGGRAAFVNDAIEAMEAIPGVRQVGLTSTIPGAIDGTINSIDTDLPFVIQDRAEPEQGQEPVAWYSQVSESFFEVMAIPLVEGRGILPTDDAQAPAVILVNEALARENFGDRSPIGETLLIGSRRVPREIVGVVANVRPSGYQSQPRPEIYVPLKQVPTGSLTFVVQTDVPPGQVAQAAMEAIWQTNPAQSIWGAATLESLLSEWLLERRFNLVLLGSFAVIALLLVAVGIYGLVSFSVEIRTAEMGIRRALGGPSATILGMVLGEGARLAAGGIVIGVVGALFLTRFLRGMLFGIEPTDPITFVALATVLILVSALATLVPAVRAIRADPVEALRSE